MSSLKTKIQADYISALKNKEEVRKVALSSIKAKITELEKVDGKELTDDGVMKVVVSLMKQRNQSIDAFKSGNRQDLVDKETAELNVIQSYLPKQMTDAEIINILSDFYSKSDFGDNRNKAVGMGMGFMNKTYPGQFDSKKLSELVNNVISLTKPWSK